MRLPPAVEQILEYILILLVCVVIVFIPPLIFPALVIMFLYFLGKLLRAERPLGISLFRTIYALLGILTFPFFYLGPQVFSADQLTLMEEMGRSPYFYFLVIYQIFFMLGFPIMAYLSAYLLTIMDLGGYILPIILLSLASLLMLFASTLSEALISPLILVFLFVLLAHMIYFSRPGVKKHFKPEQHPVGITIFHYFYGMMGFFLLYVCWYFIENMQHFSLFNDLDMGVQRILWGVVLAILFLISSSLLFRLNIWGYRIPIFALGIAIVLRVAVLYLPLLLVHIIFFNRPGVKAQFYSVPARRAGERKGGL